jgi:hypothetical protein
MIEGCESGMGCGWLEERTRAIGMEREVRKDSRVAERGGSNVREVWE